MSHTQVISAPIKLLIEHQVRGIVDTGQWGFMTAPMDAMRANHWYIEEIAAGTSAEDLDFIHDDYCWCKV